MAGDPHWSKVVLAMHMDGANGSTVFTDQKGNTVTRTGDAKISTAQSKFGGASAFFDGSGDYLTIPNSADFNFGTGDFCIEAFIRLQDVASYKGIFGGSNSGEFAIYSAGNQLEIGRWGVAAIASSGTAVLTAAQWHRVAVSRSEGVVRLFIDGVTVAEVAYTTAVTYAGLLCIGSDAGRSYGMAGYIDDVRITKGVARYTADFTPPVVTFPNGPAMISGTTKDATGAFAPRAVRVHRKSDGALSGAVTSHATTGAFSVPALDGTPHYAIAHDSDADPYWDKVVLATRFDTDSVIDPHMSSVVLGLHMDGANGSTVFQDVTGKTVTAVGNAQISTAQSKFGGASGYFDGAGDYLAVGVALLPATADFTFETWFYKSSAGTTIHTLLSHGNDGVSGRTSCYVNNDKLEFFIGGSPNLALTSATTVIAARWHHAAVTRVGSTFRLFLNGVLEASGTSTTGVEQTSDIHIGKHTDQSGDQRFWNGYLDDLRITKGVARYTANFTPPTAPFSSFKDLTGKDLVCNGTPSISTATKKYGDGALAITTANTSISVPFTEGLEFGSGSFTIEYWISVTSPANNLHLSRRSTSSQVAAYLTYFNSTGRVAALLSFDGVSWQGNLVGVSVIPTDTWVHVALVRQGAVLTLFVNGVSEALTNIGSSALLPMTTGLGIGADLNSVTSLNGYVDDLRITKGVARYVTNFTPPERAFRGPMTAGTSNALIFDDLTPD